MNYTHVQQGIFLARPNRFVAHVQLNGGLAVCHVKNTGRCRELLLPGSRVLVQKEQNPLRKTPYTLIAVYKGNILVNIDSSAPNKALAEWLPQSRCWGVPTLIKPEAVLGESRLDFYVETTTQSLYIETKGVTLEQDGVALFPDAPTQRGIKHLQELVRCKQAGHGAAVVFVVQMSGVRHFAPNIKTHPAFGPALQQAAAQGVQVMAMDCRVTPESLAIQNPVPVRL